LLRKAVDETHTLRYHYRLGTNICRVADSIHVGTKDEPLLAGSLYKEKLLPSSVERVRSRSTDEMASEMIKKLKVQLDAYPDELLGVMCPYREQRDKIYKLIEESSIGHLAVNQSDDPTFEPTKPIYVSTLHSSKGLEYRASHLAFADSIKEFSYHKNMTYTAVTRTKTALTVYTMGQLPGYLKQALNSLEPRPDKPTVADLFK
jgi:superfamily I DNA and RNA helicase